MYYPAIGLNIQHSERWDALGGAVGLTLVVPTPPDLDHRLFCHPTAFTGLEPQRKDGEPVMSARLRRSLLRPVAAPSSSHFYEIGVLCLIEMISISPRGASPRAELLVGSPLSPG